MLSPWSGALPSGSGVFAAYIQLRESRCTVQLALGVSVLVVATGGLDEDDAAKDADSS